MHRGLQQVLWLCNSGGIMQDKLRELSMGATIVRESAINDFQNIKERKTQRDESIEVESESQIVE